MWRFLIGAHCFIGLLLLNNFAILNGFNTDHITSKDFHLQQLLEAVIKLTEFYNSSYTLMNLDGIYGLRILKDQLSMLISAPKKNVSSNFLMMPSDVFQKLVSLHKITSEILQRAIPYLYIDDPVYMVKFQPILEKESLIVGEYRILNESLQWRENVSKKQGFSEVQSDDCMTGMFGTSANTTKCTMTPECSRLMTDRGYKEYALTHQILYGVTAQISGCISVFNETLIKLGVHGGVDRLRDEQCSNCFMDIVESLTELKSFNIPNIYQDLFLENQFVCPMLGYMQFLHIDWLKQILSWQHPNGCFGDFSSTIALSGRKLLLEKNLPDGCLSHRTAVATGALSQYLKFLLDPGSEQYQLHVNLFSTNLIKSAVSDIQLSRHIHRNIEQFKNDADQQEQQYQDDKRHDLPGEKIEPVIADPARVKHQYKFDNELGEENEEDGENYDTNEDDQDQENVRDNAGEENVVNQKDAAAEAHRGQDDINDDGGDYPYHYHAPDKRHNRPITTTTSFVLQRARIHQVTRALIESNPTGVSAGSAKAYVFILVVTGTILALIYRCLRKRRLTIRYRLKL